MVVHLHRARQSKGKSPHILQSERRGHALNQTALLDGGGDEARK
jgi:hypothetical protein